MDAYNSCNKKYNPWANGLCYCDGGNAIEYRAFRESCVTFFGNLFEACIKYDLSTRSGELVIYEGTSRKTTILTSQLGDPGTYELTTVSKDGNTYKVSLNYYIVDENTPDAFIKGGITLNITTPSGRRKIESTRYFYLI